MATLLLVGGDARDHDILCTVLGSSFDGTSCDHAPGVVAAVGYLTNKMPDFILVEMDMPVMDGLQLSCSIRGTRKVFGRPGCPVLW